jgi:hypothetical protein
MLFRFNLRCVRLAGLFALATFAALPSFAQTISDSAKQQIADILTVKKSLSASERKLSSNLAFLGRLGRRESVGSAAGLINRGIVDAAGMVTVDIKGSVSEGLLGQIVGARGRVHHSSAQYGSVRATLPLAEVERLARNPNVTMISEAEPMVVNSVSSQLALAREHRRAALLQESAPLPLLAASGRYPSLASMLHPQGMGFFIGSVTSQGYVSHQAREVVNSLAITGAGVKVGVLSDSASPARVAALIASGDLGPGTTVLPGLAGTGSDEGAAMMEIVQDMAPGAQIFFATANGGQAAMAANINALHAAGCSIIVDDITYLAEAAFQDGTVARGVNQAVAAGALYFSSGGNSGNLTDHTSGTWEGDFSNGGAVTSGPIFPIEGQGFFHNFNAGVGNTPQDFDVLTVPTNFIFMQWSDPFGGSNNDYDLFILDSTGTTVKGFSALPQTGTQDPIEAVGPGSKCGTPAATGYCSAAGDRIVIVLFSGVARALRLDTNRGQLSIMTAGATFGHNGGANTMTTAATYWNSAKTGTRAFTGFANPVEPFNSDGPRKIFFNPDGSAITPGNFLFGTNGGTTLQKPDITAADGVAAKTPGFLPFFGTSAAAPHAAGVAALVLSAKPTLTNNQIKTIMINTALDNMAPGPDRDGGRGIVMALPAVQSALQQP